MKYKFYKNNPIFSDIYNKKIDLLEEFFYILSSKIRIKLVRILPQIHRVISSLQQSIKYHFLLIL